MSLYNNSLQRDTMIYSFVGMERCDMLLYAAKILSAEAKSVLIVDNTYSKDLFLSVTHDPGSNMTDYRGMTIVKNVAFSPELFIDFEFVLVYHGLNADARIMSLSDKVYVFTNYEKTFHDRLAVQLAVMPETPGCTTLIFRDKVNRKVPEKLIVKDLNIPAYLVNNQIIVNFDMKDYSLYLSLTHNGSQSMKNASNAFVDALFTIVADMLGRDKGSFDKKTIQRMIKRTK